MNDHFSFLIAGSKINDHFCHSHPEAYSGLTLIERERFQVMVPEEMEYVFVMTSNPPSYQGVLNVIVNTVLFTTNILIFNMSRIKQRFKQESIPVGCVPSAAVAVGGAGVSARGCVCQGVYVQRRRQTAPLDRMTDRCKTLPCHNKALP